MANYQIGVLPYHGKKEPRVVLITTRSRNSDARWIVPKGRVERGRADRVVALMEAYEEAGIIGNIVSSKYWEGEFCSSTECFSLRIYPMKVEKVLDKWPESKERERCIVSLKKAEKLLDKPLRQCLLDMKKVLK